MSKTSALLTGCSPRLEFQSWSTKTETV